MRTEGAVYDNVRIGLTSRLDTIQAAVLSEKLRIFPDEIEARVRVARRYNEMLLDVVKVPTVPAGMGSVWAQYTIRLKPGTRDALAVALKADGIPTANMTDESAQNAIAHAARDRDTVGIEMPSRILQRRERNMLPGMAMPTLRTRRPSRSADRAKSKR